MQIKPSPIHRIWGNALGRWLLLAVVALLVLVCWRLLREPAPGRPLPPGAPANTLKTVTGLVKGFRFNPHLDVNALQLQAGRSGLLTIDFRPHTAQAVLALAAAGDSVAVAYTVNPDDEGVGYRLSQIRNLRTGKSLVLDKLPPPPDVPPNHAAEYFTLSRPQLLTDAYGGIVAIKSGRLLFHFKPGLADDILPLLKNSSRLGLSAVRRDDHFGFENIHHDTVYVVLSVTIDNKTFLVR